MSKKITILNSANVYALNLLASNGVKGYGKVVLGDINNGKQGVS